LGAKLEINQQLKLEIAQQFTLKLSHLINTMSTSGGYSWTVIPVEERDVYMLLWKGQVLMAE